MKAFYSIFVLLCGCACLHAADTPEYHITMASPLDYQVVQRTNQSGGKIIIAGGITPGIRTGTFPMDGVEARVIGKSISGELPGKWRALPFDARVAAFRGELDVPAGGWYRLEVRALEKNVQMCAAVVEHVGVGEVFVIAGQSNAANYGEERQETQTGLVAAFDGTSWQLAHDPEPGAGGTKGSFMPPFGDVLTLRLRVPVGIVAVGVGSTSVREWLPAGTRISHLPPLTRNVVTVGPDEWEPVGKIFADFTAKMKTFGPHGVRAVLWHQGESDGNQNPPDRSLSGSLYTQYLEDLIRDSRKEAGWDVPWFVAQASSHGPRESAQADIRAAQKAVWDDGVALPGPDTDELAGDLREKDGQAVHFSGKGLREHGRLWADKVAPWIEQQLVLNHP
jgi:hypothetical protein